MYSLQLSSDLLTLLNSLRDYLQQEYQERLDRVILFGSQARGDAKSESDVDILMQQLNEDWQKDQVPLLPRRAF